MVRARNLIAAAQVDWKPPAQPWIMRQTWRELLFAHWPLPIAAFTDRLPPGLALDTFDGQAWIGLVPFVMSGVRPRDLPPVAGLSRFAELNVRTYVTRDGKPGVWFYSLDASNPIAVAIASDASAAWATRPSRPCCRLRTTNLGHICPNYLDCTSPNLFSFRRT